MQDNVRIREFIKEKGLDQPSLAAAAQVSQSTVSRALAGSPQRRGRAYRKLLAYIGTASSKQEPSVTGKKRVARAFEKIWDGSDIHAVVVAKIIEDLAGLAPSPRLLRRHLEQRKRA